MTIIADPPGNSRHTFLMPSEYRLECDVIYLGFKFIFQYQARLALVLLQQVALMAAHCIADIRQRLYLPQSNVAILTATRHVSHFISHFRGVTEISKGVLMAKEREFVLEDCSIKGLKRNSWD